MTRVAKVATLETAWKLARFLEEELDKLWTPPIRFQVLLPNPETIEVWPVNPLRPEEEKAVALMVRRYVATHNLGHDH